MIGELINTAQSTISGAVGRLLGANTPTIGGLWETLWPVVIIGLSIALIRSYLTAAEKTPFYEWLSFSPLRRLWMALSRLGRRLFLLDDAAGRSKLAKGVLQYGVAMLGRFVQSGKLGAIGDRAKRRIRSFLRTQSVLRQFGIMAALTVGWSLLTLGFRADSALAYLNMLDPVVWGSYAALAVGAMAYLEPFFTGLPGVQSVGSPAAAVYAFAVVFALIWTINILASRKRVYINDTLYRVFRR